MQSTDVSDWELRVCSNSEPASMMSLKSTSSMSVFDTVSLLQWHTVIKVNLFTEQVDKTSY